MLHLKTVRLEDRDLLYNINQKYLYEMTNFYDDPMDEEGNYHYGYFEAYFTDPKREVYFICDDDVMVGFAMVNPYSNIGEHPDYTMAEFTIFPAYRRKHFAIDAARMILAGHPGKWEIKYNEENAPAKRLWNLVAAPYHPEVHHLNEEETVLSFETEETRNIAASEEPGVCQKNQLLYRLMSMEDYEAAYDLWIQSGNGLNNKDDSREGIEKYLRRNPATSFVAVLDGKIVGVILCGHDGRRGIIQHACVSPDCRRMGIGKKLVDLALEALKKEGINKVLLVAFKKNEVGNAFWESQGFTLREDLNYRNKALAEMIRIDPYYLKET